ncbi:hypothetical protein F1C12_21685 (plasmid) [Leifsonia shinshuensis]|uniref:Secreted protein n=1 Tax=Leifsonia shinshuensis TaxID=150026 RepID=A0A7G6YHD4_9MICO|nr:hypothetical protein F1C12_21685 [Leifsonia shinshuensis]
MSRFIWPLAASIFAQVAMMIAARGLATSSETAICSHFNGTDRPAFSVGRNMKARGPRPIMTISAHRRKPSIAISRKPPSARQPTAMSGMIGMTIVETAPPTIQDGAFQTPPPVVSH